MRELQRKEFSDGLSAISDGLDFLGDLFSDDPLGALFDGFDFGMDLEQLARDRQAALAAQYGPPLLVEAPEPDEHRTGDPEYEPPIAEKVQGFIMSDPELARQVLRSMRTGEPLDFGPVHANDDSVEERQQTAMSMQALFSEGLNEGSALFADANPVARAAQSGHFMSLWHRVSDHYLLDVSRQPEAHINHQLDDYARAALDYQMLHPQEG
ncbi:MAG TPA: hypothetical protein VJP80_02310 [Candidatus Saccharimonadales bacterium]|nr:hypothetical protein [Candidatus Saccharimonadales bacterium]